MNQLSIANHGLVRNYLRMHHNVILDTESATDKLILIQSRFCMFILNKIKFLVNHAEAVFLLSNAMTKTATMLLNLQDTLEECSWIW